MAKPRICQVCGSNQLSEISNGQYKCLSCDTIYENKGEVSEELIVRLNLIEDAEKDLRFSPPRFDDAEEKFEDIIRKYPNDSVGYWGIVRAKYGIKYEEDYDGKAVPSCYKSRYDDFRKDKYFLRAVELAESEALKAKYISEADKIALVCKEWREKASKYNYDIFLSFKASELVDGKEIETNDLRKMQDLYTQLTSEGYKVFFSPISLHSHGIAGQRSEPYIYNALDKAKMLIVYGSKAEYFEATWVRNEWSRYLRAMSKGRKPQGSLIVVYENFNPKELPRQLRNIQAIDINKITAYNELMACIKKINFSEKDEPIIERVNIEIKKPKTIKKSDKKDKSLDIIELGNYSPVLNTVKERKGISVRTRELGTESMAQSISEQEFVELASKYLETSMFRESEIFIEECLNRNEKNGNAWLIKLCLEERNYELYKWLIDENAAYKGFEIKNLNIHTIDNAIKYANSRAIAEKLLKLVFQSVQININSGLVDDSILKYLNDIYAAVCFYKAEIIKDLRSELLKVADIFKGEYTALQSFLSKILEHISDSEEYINSLAKLVKSFVKNGNFTQAAYFNNLLIEIDENNAVCVIYKCLIEAYATDVEEFGNNVNSKIDLDYFKSKIEVVDKKCAKELIELLTARERKLIKAGKHNEAYNLFELIVKYNFDERHGFIESHIADMESIVKGCPKFIEIYLKAVDTDKSWNISKYIEVIKGYREQSSFEIADPFCNNALKIEPNNYELLFEKLLCKMAINSGYKSVNFDKFDKETWEQVLTYCNNSDEQQSVIMTFYGLLYNYLVATEFKVGVNRDKCLNLIEVVLKYISDDEVLYKCIKDIANLSLANSQFELAEKYFTMYLQYDTEYNHEARWGLLLARLGCRNEKEFIESDNFTQDMKEYRELLFASRNNENTVKHYSELVLKNINYHKALEEENKLKEKVQLDEQQRKYAQLKKEIKPYKRAILILNVIGYVYLIVCLVAFIKSLTFINLGLIIGIPILCFILSVTLSFKANSIVKSYKKNSTFNYKYNK